MQPSHTKQEDIPASVALIGLGLVIGALVMTNSSTNWADLQNRLLAYSDAHGLFLALVMSSLSLNAIGAASFLAKNFGVNQQGKRLKLLSKERNGENNKSGIYWKRSAISLGLTALFFAFLKFFGLPDRQVLHPLPMNDPIQSAVLLGLQASFCLNVSILSFVGLRLLSWTSWLPQKWKKLPAFPKEKNTLVVGSQNDSAASLKSPQWTKMNLRALNGNLLITGSIGSGKTQGGILNLFDQLLENFDPVPSILAIDPKGTFIPEILKMIKKRGLEDRVFHLKLGGQVTFNPIYCDKPLKNAQFLNVAQMIRAASMNFMGKGSDSPFWEISAFNLMKNTLALCAAKRTTTSYTLRDLYSEMIASSSDPMETANTFRELLLEQRFDDEEKFNISCASEYFKEFSQMEEKLRTGILATATAFLNQFQEFQASQIFCPPNGKGSITTMDEIVDLGKILLFDVDSPGLARSMGTFIKLHYEQSVLNRLTATHRGKKHPAVIIADEYQDVVSTGGGMAIGDDRFCAKSREANAIAIFASQSLTSIKNSVGKEDSAKELFQNFRSMIAGHSTDLMTIHWFQELMGQEEKKRTSHSFSENAQKTSRNIILGGFEAKDANISESISTSEHKEHSVTGKEFSTLSSFETFARIYDGNETQFSKLYLKPYFLKKKNLIHSELLKILKSAAAILFAIGSISYPKISFAFPNVCSVVKTPDFMSCLGLNVVPCMCGFPPRPCAQFTYYIPQTFVEVFPDPKKSYFGDLPGAAVQLATLGSKFYGAEADNDTQSFHAHALTVPLTMIPYALMPCGIEQVDRFCFGAMSEHLGSNWETGKADLLQPQFLAWGISPKACMLKGAAESLMGETGSSIPMPAAPSCSFDMSYIPIYPPSAHSACNGWGTFYPRSGAYNGVSQTAGALMIASRLKTLGTDIFHAVPASSDEKWQMISPQASSCFREGQNVSLLETIKQAREEQRFTNGKHNGYLFTVWSKVSCCRDLAEIATTTAAIAGMAVACQGLGAL